MRPLGPKWLAATLAAAVLCAWIPRTLQAQVSSGAPACLPDSARPVVLLTRPDVGQSFRPLAVSGVAGAYLDPASSRVIVPVRYMVRALHPYPGAVQWNEETRTATFQRGGHSFSITVPPGSHSAASALVNGSEEAVDAFLCSGTLYAPARFVSRALGVGIRWYADRTVVVDPAWFYIPDLTEVISRERAAPAPAEAAAPSEAAPLSPVTELAASAELLPVSAALATCGTPFPQGVVQFLRAPAATSRRLAEAAACRILRDD